MDWIGFAFKTIAELTAALLAEGKTMEEIKEVSMAELKRVQALEQSEEDRQRAIFQNNK